MPRLLSTAELEAEYGIKRKSALSWVKDEVLPAVRVGRLIMFDREQVEEFIANGGKALPGGWKREA